MHIDAVYDYLLTYVLTYLLTGRLTKVFLRLTIQRKMAEGNVPWEMSKHQTTMSSSDDTVLWGVTAAIAAHNDCPQFSNGRRRAANSIPSPSTTTDDQSHARPYHQSQAASPTATVMGVATPPLSTCRLASQLLGS